MTDNQIAAHEKVGVELHHPAILHRSGAVSAKDLNVCGTCGANIAESKHTAGLWLELSDAEVKALHRSQGKGRAQKL